MRKRRASSRRARPHLQLAEQGIGPLLRRDYWAVIRNSRVGPVELMDTVRRHFAAFSPPELVVFSRAGDESDDEGRPLRLGDRLDVEIKGAGHHRVRVIHLNHQSLTLGTEVGHPEAGRITFGSYRNDRGDVIFHIRSHARSGSRRHRAGFLATGEVMQTSAWTDFVNRVAVGFGDGVIGFIQAVTSPCEEEPPEHVRHQPTYLARGG